MAFSLSATPYVPGQAQGTLRFGADVAVPGAIVALRQTEIANLSTRPAGIILMDASPLSHLTLRLLSHGVPTVLAVQNQLQGLIEGEEVFLDGHSGLVTSPIPAKLNDSPPPIPEAGKPVCTLNGIEIDLRASIGSISASAKALENGASSIGLVRTEYLFPENGKRPDTGYLAATFEQICQAAAPLPVTFRLVDIAGDKKPPWLGELPGIAGVLGLQGSRLYATEPVRQVYLDELKALGRLIKKYHFSVLIPYVTSLDELESLIGEIRQFLPSSVPVGVMLETPAAALSAQAFLSVADFAALGCNDLMQCLFAADRDIPELRDWLSPYNPALYRFLHMVAQQAGGAVDKIQVCGLLPQWKGTLPVLIGLGYRAFSVDPITIPWLADTIRQASTKQAAQLAKKVCDANKLCEVREILSETRS